MHSGEIKVLLVDDHAAVRKPLKLLLRDAGFQVRETSGAQAALRGCREFRPHIVLLDVTMPDWNGFECAREIAKIAPGAKLIFLTTHACEEYERAALQFDGAPLLLKKHAALGLADTIEFVLRGQTRLRRAS